MRPPAASLFSREAAMAQTNADAKRRCGDAADAAAGSMPPACGAPAAAHCGRDGCARLPASRWQRRRRRYVARRDGSAEAIVRRAARSLDKRAKELDTREALIKVAEQRVDQKIKEMEKLRQQLQAMVNQVGETQAAQLDNLVKIYETMKPKDAAKIFEALDMPVLLNVIQRMKPKSVAPIMASMAPQKAKEVTVALTKQDQLPQAK